MKTIDSKEFPMDHNQFIGWYNRCGGKEFFEASDAIELDHAAALVMEYAMRWLRITERTTMCLNDWHRSAPARQRILCPECPE